MLLMRGNKQVRVDGPRAEALKNLGYVEIDEKTGVPINPPDKDEDAILELTAKLAEAEARADQAEAGVSDMAGKLTEAETTITELTAKLAEALKKDKK